MASLTPRPQSILLNPSPSASPPPPCPLSLPSSPYFIPTPLSSSSSSSSSNDHEHVVPKLHPRSSSFPENPRRIRFAPLPVPDPALAISHDSPPVSAVSLDFFSANPTFNVASPIKEEHFHTPTVPDIIPSLDYSQSSSFSTFPPKKRSPLSRRIFRPLISWTKSMSAPSSCVDNDSLYQLSSRESTLSASGKSRSGTKDSDHFGSPLSLWSSTGSVASYASDSGRFLPPRPKIPGSISTSLSRKSSSSAPQKHPSAKPGIRMLNGRIYGRRRPYAQSSTDPFANIQSQEPEFVEWGYGGMGSNKLSERSGVGGRWKIVQGDGSTSAFGGARSAAGDDDDASGMAWVKKRRQERERLEKEKEEQEKLQAESVQSHSEVHPSPDNDPIVEDEVQEGDRTPTFQQFSSLPPPSTSNHPRPTSLLDSSEHKHTAVTLPPSAHKHHVHATNHKRDLSSFRTPIIQTPDNQDLVDILDMNLEAIMTTSGGITSEVGERIDQPRDIGHTEDSGDSASEEEDSSPAEEEEDDDDSESDIESQDEDATRKTALGAGVEIVSRHKEHQEPRFSSTTSVDMGLASNAFCAE